MRRMAAPTSRSRTAGCGPPTRPRSGGMLSYSTPVCNWEVVRI